MALALSLSFLFMLITFSFSPQSSRKLFREASKKLKELTELIELQLISIVLILPLSIFFALTCLCLCFSFSSHQRAIQTAHECPMKSSNFGLSGALKVTLQAKYISAQKQAWGDGLGQVQGR